GAALWYGQKEGNLRLEIRFQQALNEAVSLIAMCLYDSLIEGSCMIVCGPTNAGKTTFVEHLIQYRDVMFDVKPGRVLWYYGISQAGHAELNSLEMVLIPKAEYEMLMQNLKPNETTTEADLKQAQKKCDDILYAEDCPEDVKTAMYQSAMQSLLAKRKHAGKEGARNTEAKLMKNRDTPDKHLGREDQQVGATEIQNQGSQSVDDPVHQSRADSKASSVRGTRAVKLAEADLVKKLTIEMSPPATALRVTNLVGGVDLRLDGGRGAQLPLRELALSMAHVIYRPVWPRVLIKRMRIPRVTLLLYPTGQLSICGAKTHADAKRAARRFVAMLHRRVPAQLLPHQTICLFSSNHRNRRDRLLLLLLLTSVEFPEELIQDIFLYEVYDSSSLDSSSLDSSSLDSSASTPAASTPAASTPAASTPAASTPADSSTSNSAAAEDPLGLILFNVEASTVPHWSHANQHETRQFSFSWLDLLSLSPPCLLVMKRRHQDLSFNCSSASPLSLSTPAGPLLQLPQLVAMQGTQEAKSNFAGVSTNLYIRGLLPNDTDESIRRLVAECCPDSVCDRINSTKAVMDDRTGLCKGEFW
uniref:Parvo_NS1 domain-containing protein n=1 Tax=Macrostomum lignano TaxID=282301 RepID=A0A1I8HSG7_9PLAT